MTLLLRTGGWRVGRGLMVCKKKGYGDKLIFLGRLLRLELSDCQNCVKDMNHKIY